MDEPSPPPDNNTSTNDARPESAPEPVPEPEARPDGQPESETGKGFFARLEALARMEYAPAPEDLPTVILAAVAGAVVVWLGRLPGANEFGTITIWFWLFMASFALLALLRFRPAWFDFALPAAGCAVMWLATLDWARTRVDFHIAFVADQTDPAARGMWPFVDYFSQYGMVSALWQGAFTRLFGVSQVTLFLSAMLFAWLAVGLTYYLARRLGLARWAASWACLVSVVYFSFMPHPWPNYILAGLTLAFAALLAAAAGKESPGDARRRTALLFAAGVVGGLLPWTRQQGLFALLAGGLAWALFCWLRGTAAARTRRDVLAAGAGAFVAGGGILLAVVARGGWDNLILHYVTMARSFTGISTGELDRSGLAAATGVLSMMGGRLIESRPDWWNLDNVLWHDYLPLLLALGAGMAAPFWRRLLGKSAPAGTAARRIPLAAGVCLVASAVLVTGMLGCYPFFEQFRLWCAIGAATAVLAYFVMPATGRLRGARRVWALVPVLALTMILGATRIASLGRRVANTIERERTDYPELSPGGLLPMFRGMRLSAPFAAEEAAMAWALDHYLAEYPDTPLVARFAHDSQSLLPYFLVGHPAYELPWTYRWDLNPSWPQAVRVARLERFRETFRTRLPLMAVDAAEFSPFEDLPYAPLYRGGLLATNVVWGTSRPALHAPRERVAAFRRARGTVFSLERPADRLRMAEALSRTGDPHRAWHVRGGGGIGLDFATSAWSARYPRLEGWLVVGLDVAARDADAPPVAIVCEHADDPQVARRVEEADDDTELIAQKSRVRHLDAARPTAFFHLSGRAAAGWRLRFSRAADGLRLTTLDFFPLPPLEYVDRDSTRFPGAPDEMEVRVVGGDGRYAVPLAMGRSGRTDVFGLPPGAWLRGALSVEERRGVLYPGDVIFAETVLDFDDGSRAVFRRPLTAWVLAAEPSWYGFELDASEFAGRRASLAVGLTLERAAGNVGPFECLSWWTHVETLGWTPEGARRYGPPTPTTAE